MIKWIADNHYEVRRPSDDRLLGHFKLTEATLGKTYVFYAEENMLYPVDMKLLNQKSIELNRNLQIRRWRGEKEKQK